MKGLGLMNMMRVLVPDSIGVQRVMYRSSQPVRDFKSRHQIEMERKLRGATRYPRQFAPAHPPFKRPVPFTDRSLRIIGERALLRPEVLADPLVRKALKRLRRAERRGRRSQVHRATVRLFAAAQRAS